MISIFICLFIYRTPKKYVYFLNWDFIQIGYNENVICESFDQKTEKKLETKLVWQTKKRANCMHHFDLSRCKGKKILFFFFFFCNVDGMQPLHLDLKKNLFLNRFDLNFVSFLYCLFECTCSYISFYIFIFDRQQFLKIILLQNL